MNNEYSNKTYKDIVDKNNNDFIEGIRKNYNAYNKAEEEYVNNKAYELLANGQYIPEIENSIPSYQSAGGIRSNKGKTFYINDKEYVIEEMVNPMIGYDYYIAKPTDGNGKNIKIDREYFENATNKGNPYVGTPQTSDFQDSYDKANWFTQSLFGDERGLLGSIINEGDKYPIFYYNTNPTEFKNNHHDLIPTLKPGQEIEMEDPDGTWHKYKVKNTDVQNDDTFKDNYLEYWKPKNDKYKTGSYFDDFYGNKDYGIGYELYEIGDNAWGPQGWFSNGLNGRIVLPYDAEIYDKDGNQIILNQKQQDIIDEQEAIRKQEEADELARIKKEEDEKRKKEERDKRAKAAALAKAKEEALKKQQRRNNWGLDTYFNNSYQEQGQVSTNYTIQRPNQNSMIQNTNNLSKGLFNFWNGREDAKQQALNTVKLSANPYVIYNDAATQYLNELRLDDNVFTADQVNKITDHLRQLDSDLPYGEDILLGNIPNGGVQYNLLENIFDTGLNLRGKYKSNDDISNMSLGNYMDVNTSYMGDHLVNNPIPFEKYSRISQIS